MGKDGLRMRGEERYRVAAEAMRGKCDAHGYAGTRSVIRQAI